MSKNQFPPRGGFAASETSSRTRYGKLSSSAKRQVTDASDPHASWLKHWRSLRAGLGVGGGSNKDSESARELRNYIAHTPAKTLAGLQAQAELIAELAWNDVVAATAHQLIAGLKRLQSRG